MQFTDRQQDLVILPCEGSVIRAKILPFLFPCRIFVVEIFGDILIISVFIVCVGKVVQIVQAGITKVDIFDARSAFTGRAVCGDERRVRGGFDLNTACQIAHTDAYACVPSDMRIGAEADPALPAVEEKRVHLRWELLHS